MTTAGSGQNHAWVGECDAVVTIDQTLVPVPPLVSQAMPPFSTSSATVVVPRPLAIPLRSWRFVSSIPPLHGPLPVDWLSSARTT